jgi:predicted DNA-binding transcriptional regulator AlpA
MLHEPAPYLIMGQVTRRVDRGPATIRKWVRQGIFPQPSRIGRLKAWVWPEPVIESWLAEHPELGAEK